MNTERNTQILVAGLKAAHECMYSDRGLRRPEYPRDLAAMYSGMEDELFALYNAIQDNRYAQARTNAAGIIVLASEVIEYVEFLVKAADKE